MFVAMTDEEAPEIASLLNRAYRGSGADAGWTTEAAYLEGDRATAEMLRADVAAKPAASMLKWVEPGSGRLIGCVWLEPVGGDFWYLGSLAVNPGEQNSGLGRALLTAAEQWVYQRGGRRIRMTVINVRDRLIAWYERRGYRRTGETAPFPYGDNRFGRPLRDDLGFVVLEKGLKVALAKPGFDEG